MPPILSPLTVQRLAYVRYLYQQGIEQSSRPSPLSASALLAYHDAVENLLGLIAEHLDAEVKPGTTFMGYWEAIKPKLDLPGKHNMKRLNDARVALKHSGTFPSQQSLEQSRETVHDFFITVVPRVFNVDFNKIDMVDLVAVERTAQALREAQTHADADDFVKALAGLNVAFRELLRYCSGLSSGGKSIKSPFVFGLPSPIGPGKFINTVNRREPWAPPMVDLRKQVVDLRQSVGALGQALQVVSLDIDYAAYARFRVLTPEVRYYFEGPPRYQVSPFHRTLSEGDYDFCRTFVIESALTVSSARAVLMLHEAARTNQDGIYAEGVWDGPAAPRD